MALRWSLRKEQEAAWMFLSNGIDNQIGIAASHNVFPVTFRLGCSVNAGCHCQLNLAAVHLFGKGVKESAISIRICPNTSRLSQEARSAPWGLNTRQAHLPATAAGPEGPRAGHSGRTPASCHRSDGLLPQASYGRVDRCTQLRCTRFDTFSALRD
jgi:hypothetical protein